MMESLGLVAGAPERRVNLDALPNPIWVTGHGGASGYGNLAWSRVVGDDARDIVDWQDVVHPADRQRIAGMWELSQQTSEAFTAEIRLRHRAGGDRWFAVMANPLSAPWSEARQWLVSCTEIDARVRAQDDLAMSIEIQSAMLDASVDCINIVDVDGIVLHMNKSGCAEFGLPLDTTTFGMQWLGLLPAEFRGRGRRALNIAKAGENSRFSGKKVIDGRPAQHWDNLLTPMKTDDGTTTKILCVSRDVTSQREAESRLRIADEFDDLTGLRNRRSFTVHLKRVLSRARSAGQSVGLLLVDLDHFKLVNDTLGHQAGDHLLRVLSRRLESCLPEGGYVARLGGDEFGLVVENVTDDALIRVAECAAAQMDGRITYAGKVINGGMSIGGAMYPRDSANASGLMKSADTALNDLKEGGRGGIRMFSEQMMTGTEDASAQRIRARQLIRDSGVMPYYQPKIRLSDQKIIGFEALLRWRDSAGLHLPGSVAEAFNDYELAARLGDMMHLKVCRDISSWIDAGVPVVPVSLNAAPVEFLRNDYAERLLQRMAAFKVPTSLVEVEVTEHILADRGSEHVVRALNELKAQGVRVALDDFGTGHSSLSHLRDYPVDCVKVDGEFVRRCVDDPAALAIVRAIIALGPGLGLDVVAEGIETELQCQTLWEAGCDIGQGFLFSEAIDPMAVAAVLQSAEGLNSGRSRSGFQP